ncbi:MAG: rRNA processing protein [Pycnora praestabilis]|nr:MAG: rRNA processing protein [Pycnora praestabilis]
MGSSARKKKDKKKDFQKPKLKVGKARPKPSNFTDTSFKAKAIVLNQQSLTTVAPSSILQFTHHISLLTHKADSQRRDSLAYLTTAISARPVDAPLPQPLGIVLPKLLPLILDGSNSVRSQLIKLFRTLPTGEVENHVDQLLLYVRVGMTHLGADIRGNAIEVLVWLLEIAGDEVVSCAGGWIQTLKCFLALLGWQTDAGTKWSSSKASLGKAGSEGKELVRNLQAFAVFLRVGLLAHSEDVQLSDQNMFPLWHAHQHMLPTSSYCFARLNLFSSLRDEDGDIYEDYEDRQRLFSKYVTAIEIGLESAKKEGGEVGRAAAAVTKVLKEVMEQYDVMG